MRRKGILIMLALLVSFIVMISLLYYPEIDLVISKYLDPPVIKVYFAKGLQFIRNVSVSLYAFYPTSNGTVITKIFQGNNLKCLIIPLSNLTTYAKHWIKHYGYSVVPSLIGFVSYYVNESNGSIVVYTQPFSIRVSPYNITHGIGKVEIKEFINPIAHVRKHVNKNNKSVMANTVTTTTTTVPPTYTSPYPSFEIGSQLDAIWYYPSSNSFGPLPLSVVYITDSNFCDYEGDIELTEQSATSSGFEISFGITVLGAINIGVNGVSITTQSSNIRVNSEVQYGKEVQSQFAEIFTCGQFAVVNYTVYCCVGYGFGGWNYTVTEVFLTGLEINGSNSNYVPALYTVNSPLPTLTPLKYFEDISNNETYIGSVHCGSWTYNTYNLEFATCEGYIGGSVPVGLIISALPIGEVPTWVTLVVSPYISIVPFTSNTEVYSSVIGLTGLTNTYIYHVYMLYSNVTYSIGSKNYNIPYYFYYINYTNFN
ncbi:hypothetical protein SJAV_14570 [Sulfurisphaera javensis]|uniref:Uncharacterized protein n=1 Tax=Sulfurisphaera javensis TaxID=2049879 RepID=A0AAT9GRI2_9CREN